MKMKFLLYSFAVAAAGAGFIWQNGETVADYTPRDAQKAQEARGAAEVLRMMKGNIETGEIEPADYVKMQKAYRDFVRNSRKTVDMSWETMGPTNIGGRTRAILAIDNNTIFCGAVSGGLWKSTDAGNNWSRVESFATMPIASIARNGNGTIFIGTGPSFDGGGGGQGGSSFPGYGLYKSTDGVNWEVVDGTQPSFLNPGADWAYIDELAADPTNADRIWIAMNDGLAFYDESSNNLHDPDDDGPLSGLPANTLCQDIQVSADGTVMIASVGSGDVYRSLDGGNNWEPMFANNDPTKLPQTGVGRMELAVAPSNSNYMYALAASTGGSMAGAWYSTDKGNTWTQGWPGGVDEVDLFGSNGQGIYDNIITVDPNDPTRAICGGVTLWQFGSNAQPEQIAFNFTFPGSPLYVHSDIHEFEWAPNGDLYIGTDGGIHKSTDGGQTFFTANRGMITTQFYGIAYTPSGGLMGGTQDNGTLYVPFDGSLNTLTSSTSIFGGDGFDCAVSQITETTQGVAFATSQYGVLGRLQEQGTSGAIYDNDIMALENAQGRIGQFYTCIQLHENTEDELSQQFIQAINPFEETVTSTAENPIQILVTSENQNIPFYYTLPEGTTLNYYEELIRPEVLVTEPLTEDPNYFWLEPQMLTDINIDCVTEEIPVDTITVIDQITPIDTVIYFEYTLIIDGEPVVFIDSTVVNLGADTTYIDQTVYEQLEVCDTTFFYAADTLYNEPEHILIQDQYTSMLAVGFEGNLGLWLTRQGLDFNTTPDWWPIIQSPGGTVKSIEFTPDGKHMFYSTWNGRVYRVDGLELLWSEEDLVNVTVTQIFTSGGAAVTGIAIDPNDNDHVVITIGGYGGTGKVRESVNATGSNPTFSNIWNPPSFNGNSIEGMPCYDAMIDMTNDELIVVATEFGMFATDDGGDTWTEVNNGDMNPAPVFSVKQQWRNGTRFSYPTNTGCVYAGAHGRGLFQSKSIVSVQEPGNGNDLSGVKPVLVYPNPAQGVIQMDLDLPFTTDVSYEIYSITGKLVRSDVKRNLSSGTQTVRISVADLSEGNYILRVGAAGKSNSAKFVIQR